MFPKECYNYCKGLEAAGKKVLVIWPYHCLQGTVGHALDNQFSNMVFFHEVARSSLPQTIVKGTDILSEMYGGFKPEFSTKNLVNLPFLNYLETFDKVIIAGEAKSHCVLESIKQILEHYQTRLDVTKKIYILEDCMSTIPGFEADTEAAFAQFRQQHHVNIVKSTDLVL